MKQRDWILPPRTSRSKRVLAEVSDRTGFTVAEIKGPRRQKMLSHARQEVMCRLIDAGLSYPQAGRVLNRDHTTVIYGRRAHLARIAKDVAFTEGSP